MRAVILDGFEEENLIGAILKKMFEGKGEEFSYFKLKDMNILPCRSCGACSHKTPGKCVFEDEMPSIIKAFAKSDVMIMLTPIRFGGYSSQLKKALDKFVAVGLPLYIVKDGHMLHPMRYDSKLIIGIGIALKDVKGAENNFRTLVERNGLNMQCTQKTLIFKPSDDIRKIKHEIEDVLRGEV
ncbi:flavodoxin family protein [Clostridium sp. Marseille-QA1073]